MKKLERLSMVATMLLFSTMMTFARQKLNAHILATGGTIAGTGTPVTTTNYVAGQVAIGTLLNVVSELKNIANVAGEQIVEIGSQDMNNDVWLTLTKKISQLLRHSDIDGIVITHGTDTMEETACFPNLTVKNDRPVVLVGAMHPSTVLGAGGPLSLYNAVAVTGAEESKGKSILVAMNGSILGTASVLKMDTANVQTFQTPNGGVLGYVLNDKVTHNMSSTKKHTTQSIFDVTNLSSLLRAGIVYSYSNIKVSIVAPMLDNGYKGITHAGVGNGNVHKDIFPILIDACKKGMLMVRSSRVPTGPTSLDAEVDGAQYQFIAPQELNPQKSRVLLMLALTKVNDWKQIQGYPSGC